MNPSANASVAGKAPPNNSLSAARWCPARRGSKRLEAASGTRPRVTKGSKLERLRNRLVHRLGQGVLALRPVEDDLHDAVRRRDVDLIHGLFSCVQMLEIQDEHAALRSRAAGQHLVVLQLFGLGEVVIP